MRFPIFRRAEMSQGIQDQRPRSCIATTDNHEVIFTCSAVYADGNTRSFHKFQALRLIKSLTRNVQRSILICFAALEQI